MSGTEFDRLFKSAPLHAFLKRRAAYITKRETREDAVQEAWADILALSPASIDEAKDIGKRAISRIESRAKAIGRRETTALDLDRFEAR